MVAHPQVDTSTLDHLMALRDNQTSLTKTVGHGPPALRDAAGNILVLNPAASNPLLVAQGHDVALNMAPSTVLANRGTLTVTDETGLIPRPIVASNFYGDVGDPVNGNVGPSGSRNVWSNTHGEHFGATNGLHTGDTNGVHTGNTNGLHTGDTSGVHFGSIGTPGQAWYAHATLFGNSNGVHTGDTNGTHFGSIGTPGQGWRANATLYGDSNGTHFGSVGTPGQGWYCYITCLGNVGLGGENWQLHGTVYAPSERHLKTDIQDLPEAGAVVDAVPVHRWRWGSEEHDDGHEHAGPMVDDIAAHAPWLVHQTEDSDIRSLADRDLLGVLWGALRDARERITALELAAAQ